MQNIPLERLELNYGADVLNKEIHYSLDPVDRDCSLSRRLPVLVDSLTIENIPCNELLKYDLDHDDELQHFEPLPNSEPGRRKKKSWWKRVFG